MSGIANTTLEALHDRVDEPEVDDGKRECLNDWCSERIHKNAWSSHIWACEPPEDWDDKGDS